MGRTKQRPALPIGAPDRFREWLAEGDESSEEETAVSRREPALQFGPLDKKHQSVLAAPGFGQQNLATQPASGKLKPKESQDWVSATAGSTTRSGETSQDQESTTAGSSEILENCSEEMGRGTASKAGKSNGVLKKGGVKSKREEAPLTDIVEIEAHSPTKEESAKAKVVHYTEVLAADDSDSDGSDAYSSAEEASGPIFNAYNPFKSKLSSRSAGARKNVERPAVENVDKPVQKVDKPAVQNADKPVQNAEGTTATVVEHLKENMAQIIGASLSKATEGDDKTQGDRKEIGGQIDKTPVAVEGKPAVPVGVSQQAEGANSSLEENKESSPPKQKAAGEAQPSSEQGAQEKERETNPRNEQVPQGRPASTEGPRTSPEKRVDSAQVAAALKQTPGGIVAEIDAIAERITSQGGGARGGGLPPRNSFSAGAAFQKLHSQGDSSLKSPEGKVKQMANAIRDRALSEGGEGKAGVPNFWSRFIPVHAFQQPGEGGSEEGGDVRSRPNQVERSVSEVTPARISEITPKVEESGLYARSKSMDSGFPPTKSRTPLSSPLSVLSPKERQGEATSPRSPHSPTKPPLPPILKSSSRFNGNSHSNSPPGRDLPEALDLEGGEKSAGRAPPESRVDAAPPPRRDSPRRVSFMENLPTLKKAASFSPSTSGGIPAPPPGLSKSTSLPRNTAELAEVVAEGLTKDAGGKQGGSTKALDAAEILQTSDTDELLGAFGAAGYDLDGLIRMAEDHLREARKGMSPEPKKTRPPQEEKRTPASQKNEKETAQKPVPKEEAKTPYLSIPDFDEEEWASSERSTSPTPRGKPPRGGRNDTKASQSMDLGSSRNSGVNTRRHSDCRGSAPDDIRKSWDPAAQQKFDDFGRSSLERLDPVLDTVLERVLANDEFMELEGERKVEERKDVGKKEVEKKEVEVKRKGENGEVRSRGAAKNGGNEEVIFWGADDDAEREAVQKLEREKGALQASVEEKAKENQAEVEQERRALRGKRSQLESEIGQLCRKVSLQRSLRSSFNSGWGGDPDRLKEDGEIRQLEEEVEKMRRTKDELVGTLESAREAEGAAEKMWELRETRAQLEEDLARLMAQKAAGGFAPQMSAERAQLEADVARMKQELQDLEKQRTSRDPQAEMQQLKEERLMLEQKLALAIGEIALESVMSPQRGNKPADEFEELNLGLLEEGNARLQQQLQEVKQQAARQRAGIIIGSEERTQALQKLLETRNLYEEELAATVQQIMEEKQKNDEIEKMVHGNMSALERALAQQQQALSEAQEVLQAERMRSQTMRASVENISQAAIPGLLKNRSYSAPSSAYAAPSSGYAAPSSGYPGSPSAAQKNNHFAINFHSLETGGSDYLSQQLAGSRNLVFRDSDIRRRMHDEDSDAESSSHDSTISDSRSKDLALPAPPKNRITELPTTPQGQNRARSEALLTHREAPRSPSQPQYVGKGGLGYQLEHSQERRNQILKQFSGPIEAPSQQRRPNSAGPLRGNRYSLG